MTRFELRPVGRVESTLADTAAAPRQGDEGAPDAWLVFDPAVAEAVDGLAPGIDVLLLTWLDKGDRSQLVVHPRGDTGREPESVFLTRSPDRPNPIGLHRVRIAARDGLRVRVEGLEAIDGTPVLDVKPILGDIADR